MPSKYLNSIIRDGRIEVEIIIQLQHYFIFMVSCLQVEMTITFTNVYKSCFNFLLQIIKISLSCLPCPTDWPTNQPTSSISTLDTSGSASAPPFLPLFFPFPLPVSSPATASRNLFWFCDLCDLGTESVRYRQHFSLFAPFPQFPSELWRTLTLIGDTLPVGGCVYASLHGIWVAFLVCV